MNDWRTVGFVIQILNRNFAVARLKDFTDKVFSEAAYCKARARLPLKLIVAAALVIAWLHW